MPLYQPLPNVQGDGLDSLLGGFGASQSIIKSLMENQQKRALMPLQMGLLQAKAQQANASGLKNTAWGNLLNNINGGSMDSGGTLGAPDKSALIAGLLHIPIQHGMVDGVAYRVNPFTGQVSTNKIGFNPADKAILDRETHESNLHSDINQKKADETYKTIQDYNLAADTLSKLQNLLDKNPHLTGPLKGNKFSRFLSNDPELGTFTSLSGDVLTNIAKNASPRAGAVLFNLFKNFKTDPASTVEYNKGIIKALRGELSNKYARELKDYHHYSGNPYEGERHPFLNVNSSNNIVRVKDNHTGKIISMPKDQYEKLVQGEE